MNGECWETLEQRRKQTGKIDLEEMGMGKVV